MKKKNVKKNYIFNLIYQILLLATQLVTTPYLSRVLGADGVTNAKPHPEPVLKTLSALGFSPEEAIVVGDMPVDILMGKGAGTRTCGVTYGNSCREDLSAAGADMIIDNFSELLNELS